MNNRIKNIIGFFLLLAFFVLVSFTKNEQDKKSVKNIRVFIDATKGDPFLDENDVIDLIYSRYDTLLGKEIGDLYLNEVENLLRSQPSIKNTEVYIEHHNNVNIEIELRKIIARIKPDSSPGFYIDNEGKTMSWSTKYSPRVLTITGHLNYYNRYIKDTVVEKDLSTHSKLIKDVHEFAKYVNSSSFWKAQLGQVYIDNNGDAILIPLIGNEEFMFGELTDYVRKFDKIKRYYQEITPKLGWNKYKEINVKFDRQIVCK
jgi:cell division protein FtsQ